VVMVLAVEFQPYEKMASVLMATLGLGVSDGAHDSAHILRVWRNVCAIAVALIKEMRQI
jgi:hypothetical protein